MIRFSREPFRLGWAMWLAMLAGACPSCGISDDVVPNTPAGGAGGTDAAGDAVTDARGPDTGASGDSGRDGPINAGGAGGVGGTDAGEDAPADEGGDAGDTPIDATPADGTVADAPDATDGAGADASDAMLDAPDGSTGIARARLFTSVSGALVGQSTGYRIRMAAGGPQPRGSGTSTSYRLKIGW